MSSLAAARADNFYYPPEYRSEHGSLNKFRGSHPLGERAKKINEGILVIRFEMPYKVFCNKCNEVIAKGVRFNAEKRTVGQYFTTKILEFSMKCCFCDNTFKIHTDPKNCEYVPVSGLRRKVETFTAEDAQTLEYRSAEERQELEKDPMLKLESTSEDLLKATQAHRQLEALMALNESRHSSDVHYDLNLRVRKRFRETKKLEVAREAESKKPRNFAIPLVAENPMDRSEAASIDFSTHARRLNRRIEKRLKETSSIFLSQTTDSTRRPSKTSTSSSRRVPIASNTTVTDDAPPPPPPARLVPCPSHSALSLVIPQAAVKPPTTAIRALTQHEKRVRLCTGLEKIKSAKRNVVRASILAQRNRTS